MNNRSAYRLLLIESECVKNRAVCNKKCKDCPYSVDMLDLHESLNYVINILKSRDPELYFCHNIEELKEVMQNANQNKEIE